MNIYEAIHATTPVEPFITRRAWQSWTDPNNGPRRKLEVTDSPDRCVIYSLNLRPMRHWQPSRVDLEAEDWEPVP